MAANTFLGTVDNNWGTAGNWSLLAVPTAGDGNTATFSGLSPNCTVNASNRVCNHIDFTGYTNTITMTNTITVSGNITYDASMLIAGSGLMAIDAAGTITSNGKTWPNAFSFLGANPYTATLADDMTVSSTVAFTNTHAGAGVKVTLNGNNLYAGGNLTIQNNGSRHVAGTTTIILNGTGTWSGGTSSQLQCPLIINTAGTITISGAVNKSVGTITYVAGTVVTTGSTLVIPASCSLDIAGINLNALTISTTGTTATLLDDINCTLLSLANTITVNGFNIYTTNMSCNAAVTGTTLFEFSGTWTGVTGSISNSININGATPVITGTCGFGGGTLTNMSGTNVTASAATLVIASSCSLDTVNIDWGAMNIVIAANHTVTLISALRINGTFTWTGVSGGTNAFAGTAGWDCNTFTSTTAVNRTYTLASGVTYRIRSAMTMASGTDAAKNKFQSSSAGVQAILTLDNGATQDLTYVSATDIDSSAGQTMWSFKGVLSNATNWRNLSASSMQRNSSWAA